MIKFQIAPYCSKHMHKMNQSTVQILSGICLILSHGAGTCNHQTFLYVVMISNNSANQQVQTHNHGRA